MRRQSRINVATVGGEGERDYLFFFQVEIYIPLPIRCHREKVLKECVHNFTAY